MCFILEWLTLLSLSLFCPLFSLRSHCISQILESVNHIHQHDIVHRDLKVSGCPLLWQPHTHTHLCSWPWQHTDGSRFSLYLSLSLLSFSLHSCFYHLLLFSPCVSSLPPFVPFFPPKSISHLFSDVSARHQRCLSVCERVSEWVCMWSAGMVSHGHVQGSVSHLWQGKDKDSSGTRTHCAFVREGVYYKRRGTDKPHGLPRQPKWHHTTHREKGEWLILILKSWLAEWRVEVDCFPVLCLTYLKVMIMIQVGSRNNDTHWATQRPRGAQGKKTTTWGVSDSCGRLSCECVRE